MSAPAADDGSNARPARPQSVVRFATTFGGALVVGQVGQFVWLVAGSRAMSTRYFGAVLAAQALYGALQIVVDTGAGFYGARRAAAGTLDDASRSSITRLRLQLAAGSALVVLVVGVGGGRTSLAAAAPFAVALLLFGALNYWEPFGLGNSKPWSAYVVGRSIGPALAACAAVALSRDLPVVAVGIVECAAIVAISAGFRLGSWRTARLALHAEPGPWRSVLPIGLPAVLSQVGLAAGPVLLNLAGASGAAAIVAVSVRLLNGVNGIAGVVITSLFPRLARSAEGDDDLSPADASAVRAGIKIVFLIATFATAVLLAGPSFFVNLFLNRSSSEANAATILMLSSSAAAGLALFVALLLVAKHGERLLVGVYGISTALMVGGTVAVVATSPRREALLVVVVLGAAQVATALLLAQRAARSIPVLRRPLAAGAVGSALIFGVGLAGALAPRARVELAVLTAATGVLVLGWIASVWRTTERLPSEPPAAGGYLPRS